MSSFWEDTRETIGALIETVVEEVKNAFETLRDIWPMLLLLVLIFLGIIAVSNPPPPKKITMATGPLGSSYDLVARKYAAILGKSGITLDLKSTTGTGENRQLISDPNSDVQVAFLASGLIDAEQAKGVVSLGSVEYGPLWLFYRKGVEGSSDQSIRELLNKRVSIGPVGSATNEFVLQLLTLNNIIRPPRFVDMAHADAVLAIEHGDIDAMFVIDALESPTIQSLVNNPQLLLANFVRANAYTRILPYLEKLEIDEGALDLSRNFPAQKTQILATTVLLVSKNSLHPALQMLMLEAAKEVNGKETFFTYRGEFPSYKDSHLPESEEALIYYEKGPPFLMRYLPFWVAEFIHRMIFVMLPFLIVAYPILLSLPGYRLKRMKARITHVYGDLKALEQAIERNPSPDACCGYLARLTEIEKRAKALKVTKTVASDYFSLLTTIDFLRSVLEKSQGTFIKNDLKR